MSRRWPQRHDVGFQHDPECRDVENFTFWNVVTLDLNVVTLDQEHHDVGSQCHDVGNLTLENVATLARTS